MLTTPLPHELSDSNRCIIDTPGPSLRVYQVWKGSNVSSLSSAFASLFANRMVTSSLLYITLVL